VPGGKWAERRLWAVEASSPESEAGNESGAVMACRLDTRRLRDGKPGRLGLMADLPIALATPAAAQNRWARLPARRSDVMRSRWWWILLCMALAVAGPLARAQQQ
jgi:hypothetical protein